MNLPLRDLTTILGFMGSILVAFAYAPQIWHLMRVNCTCSLSKRAWILWLIATIFFFTHAIAIKDPVFIALTLVNLIAVLMIVILIMRLKTKSRATQFTERCE